MSFVGVGIGIGLGVKLGAAIKALLIAGAVVAVVSVLTWERVKLWFQSRAELVARDKDNVAFSLAERLDAKKYKTVYGIFNTRTETLVAAEAVTSQSLDDALGAHHEREPLVVYR